MTMYVVVFLFITMVATVYFAFYPREVEGWNTIVNLLVSEGYVSPTKQELVDYLKCTGKSMYPQRMTFVELQFRCIFRPQLVIVYLVPHDKDGAICARWNEERPVFKSSLDRILWVVLSPVVPALKIVKGELFYIFPKDRLISRISEIPAVELDL